MIKTIAVILLFMYGLIINPEIGGYNLGQYTASLIIWIVLAILFKKFINKAIGE